MNYAELHCLSNFSFQRGASSALELFERAKRQGYSALAITDECTLSGIVRAWQAAKAVDLPLIIGSEMHIENGPKLVLLVESLSGYQHLCRLITLARRRAEKGSYRRLPEVFEQPLPGLLALWVGSGWWAVAVLATAYEVDGVRTTEFPYSISGEVKPVYTDFEGWKCDLRSCRRYEDFPEAFKRYVEFIERETGVPVKIISVGPDRDETIER